LAVSASYRLLFLTCGRALEGCREEDREEFSKLKELAYIRQEMKNPLSGIRFTHRLLENTTVSEHQKQFLDTSDACERQIMTIIEDMDFRSIEEG
jgi:phytochrome E